MVNFGKYIHINIIYFNKKCESKKKKQINKQINKQIEEYIKEIKESAKI